jgi:hypothetical protein
MRSKRPTKEAVPLCPQEVYATVELYSSWMELKLVVQVVEDW